MGKTGPLLATATVAGLQVMLLIRTQATQRITLCNSGAGGFGQVQQDNSESVVSNIRFLLLQDGIHMCWLCRILCKGYVRNKQIAGRNTSYLKAVQLAIYYYSTSSKCILAPKPAWIIYRGLFQPVLATSHRRVGKGTVSISSQWTLTRVEMRLSHAVRVQDTPAYLRYGLPGNRLNIWTAKVVCMTSLQEQVARLVLEFALFCTILYLSFLDAKGS